MGINATGRKKGVSKVSENEARSVLDSIRRLVQGLRVAARAAESELGLSGAQLFVLQRLDGEEGMSVNDLAERTHTHQSSVSVVVQRLVEKGLVKRQPAEEDRRRVELSLTLAGRKLLMNSPEAAQDRILAALEEMPQGACGRLARNLGDLVKRMGLEGDEPPMIFEEEVRRVGGRKRRMN